MDQAGHPSAPASAGGVRWSAAGWFGSVFGCTAWLAVAALVVGVRTPAAGIGPALAAALTLGLGAWLWRKREAWPAYNAVQTLVGVGGVLALGGLLWIDAWGRLDALWRSSAGAAPPARAAYAALLVYPGLMAMFWRRRRSISASPGARGEAS